jgi:hypothetical protein
MNDDVLERDFFVEMRPGEHVKSISLSEGDREGVLFEGVPSELDELGKLDEAVFTARGAHGTLRIDINEKELRQLASKDKADTEES